MCIVLSTNVCPLKEKKMETVKLPDKKQLCGKILYIGLDNDILDIASKI